MKLTVHLVAVLALCAGVARGQDDAGVALGEPVVVALAPAKVRGWGPYQFPGLERLPDGSARLSFHVEADSAQAYGLPPASPRKRSRSCVCRASCAIRARA